MCKRAGGPALCADNGTGYLRGGRLRQLRSRRCVLILAVSCAARCQKGACAYWLKCSEQLLLACRSVTSVTVNDDRG